MSGSAARAAVGSGKSGSGKSGSAKSGSARSGSDWHAISEDLQTALAQQAMHRAALIVAEQAEMFARQFTSGTLEDRGAEDALRLFAALLRETSHASLTTAGHA